MIDNLDQLSGDISRVQSELHLNDAQYSKGVWTNKLRVLAYKYFASNLNNYKGNIGGFSDTNGFIDKDIETILERTKI